MKIRNIKYKNYGNCLEILNAKEHKIIITIDVGPRIIFFGKEDNLLFEDAKDCISKDVSSVHEKFKGEAWHIYGGHRLWKSPEDELTYYPDNNSCNYLVEDNCVTVTSPMEITTSLVKAISIKEHSRGFKIINSITNMADVKTNIAAWTLTVFKPHGYAIMELSQNKTGYLPNRNITLWDYTAINDERLNIYDDAIVIDVKEESLAKKTPLKIGTYMQEPSLMYLKDDLLFKKTVKTKVDGFCVDMHSTAEIYTINHMVELESLSKLNKLSKNKSIKIFETWELYNNKSKEYKRAKSIVYR